MKRFWKIYIFLIITGALFSSCNITKYVPENEFLLNNNEFHFKKDSIITYDLSIDSDELNSILKQKPNRRIFLGLRFHLRLYNLSNQQRIDNAISKNEKKAEKKNEKIKAKNEKKKLNNPHYSPKLYVERKLSFGERLRSAGEEPVVINQHSIEKSRYQLSVYLINKGYFDNYVLDSISILKKKKKQANVIYTIHAGQPYVYRNIEYNITDSVLLKYLDSIQLDSYILKGEHFDTDLLDLERKRITDFLMDKGYRFFNKEFIYFSADTSIGDHKIDIVLGIQNYKYKAEFTDTIYEKKHKQYKISKVNFKLYSESGDSIAGDTNTIHYRDISITYLNKLLCKKHLLYDALAIKKGSLYNKTFTEQTYKKLSGLGLFNSVSIGFDTSKFDNGLIANITLEPAKSQTFILSADGTNNEGLFGIQGSLNYSHRNIFKGAEKLSISMSGGVETQLLVTGDEDENSDNINEVLFNTIEFGPRISLLFPKYLFINGIKFLKGHTNGKTELNALVNYQKRPDFTRTIQEFSYGWIVHEKGPYTWYFNPLQISAIDIDKTEEFENQINELNDRFIAASFQDHIIAGGHVSFEYNGQNDRKVKNVFYLKTSLESGGGLLYRIHQAVNKPIDNPNTNSYDLLGIRYAHFQKLSLDLRYYIPIGLKSKLVYRLAGGIGVPRQNLKEALPFEKSFYSGGANGMRAWRARSLGPGNYLDENNSYDKIGDIQIEANFEARFPLISWIEGALFVDAGNIWLLNKDSLRVGGDFDKTRFISEIAVGAGLGLRMDLDFFIIRFDFAMPMKNPSIPMDPISGDYNRWIFQGKYSDRKDFYKLQFNLGIGYPF